MDSQREQIIEYIRGELEGSEKIAFEKLLAKNAKFRLEFEKHKNLWEMYGKLPHIEAGERLKRKTLHAI